MDSFGRPVGQDPQDPYKYKVDEIQKDKESKENLQNSRKPHSNKSVIGAYILHLIRKFFELFEETTEVGLTASAEEIVKGHLKLIKSILEILKRENKSEDSQFLGGLSRVWHEILEDALRFKKKTPFARKFQIFIQMIQDYPRAQEHSLGYYLTEYAGKKWLPFPYMEMVQNLQAEYQADPESSALTTWTREIDELLRSFQI